MKRLTAAIFVLMMCLSLFACGDVEESKKSDSNTDPDNKLLWNINDNGTLTVSCKGKLWSEEQASAPWAERATEIKTVVIEEGVTVIPNNAFKDCVNLTSVSIPVSVVAVGDYAFYNCPKLIDVVYYGTEHQWSSIDIGAHNGVFTGDSTTDTDTTTSTTVSETESQAPHESSSVYDDYDFSIDITVSHHVEIEVKDYGIIKLELDPSYAPITVDNFITLAKEGFYDGLTFHRIIEGFMIQGGDPKHNGTGGSDTPILGEFSSNGIENDLSHKRGVISMARSQLPNSASSPFFICHAVSVFLGGQYAAFGWVTEGMEVVDAIAETATPIDSNGTIVYEEQPVITKITVID